MDKRFVLLAKTGSRIEHERSLASACFNVCQRVLERQDGNSSVTAFREREAIADVLYWANVLLAKEGSKAQEQANKLYSEILDIRYRRAENKRW